MRLRSFLTMLMLVASAATATAAPPIELELVTERGVQITAPHEWLQLLTSVGVDHVQVRGLRGGEQPSAKNVGSVERPSFLVIGLLTSRDELRLPGGTFTRGERAKLKDYLERLAADGAESLTAPRGRFGLTEQELVAVFADLTPAIDFATKDQPLLTVLEKLQPKLKSPWAIDAAANRIIREAKPVADELQGITIGTAVAILLRHEGLVFRPEKQRGRAVEYHVLVADADALRASTLGKTESLDPNLKNWPIGWEPDKAPGEAAPSLLDSLNAEIDGYTLDEALAAVRKRLKLPLYIDHAALAAHNVDPAKIEVKVTKARYSYKRLLDRVLAPARLGSSLRIDESGSPFLWATR
ncbi:MAG: hypothetical protein U0805_13145 [Pirellulales bacterium]